jgi:two-component system response regulator CpxR
VILDVMLPEINGFELLRRIRANSQIPVLMLTARGNDIDKIVGLEIGADDYVPKPFNPRELVARIRAILRRIKPEVEPITSQAKTKLERLVFDDLQVNPNTRTVLQSGKSLDLTTVEFDLLLVLLRAEGGVVSREDLVVQALGRRFLPYDRSIDTHMSNLRKKLGKRSDNSERIKAIRNIGYRYVVGE